MPLDQADWSTAVPDWESRILEGRSLIPDLPLFEPSAEKALRIFDRLRVPDLPGTPLRKDVSPAWVREYIATIFGCYDPATRRRMIQEFFLMIPKKNTKSDLAATIILIAAIMNDRPKAELVLIAPSHNVAEIAFEQIAGMIALDRDLGGPDGLGKEGGVFLVQTHLKKITHKTTKATIEIESADGDIVTGSKAAYVLVDETHELAAKAKAGKVLLELRGGLASRPEGFFLQITTQSKIEPQGQFKKELQEARAVRDGTVKSPLLAVIYEFPPKMQKSQKWMDESTWGMVNPNLNVSVDLAFLRKEFDKAKRAGMEDVAMFASQHLNVEVGLGLHSERWVAANYWTGCSDNKLSLDELLDRSEVAVAGGDIGGADDLLGFGVMGREKETRRWLFWAHAWCTKDALENRKEIAPKLQDLADAGDLTIDNDIDHHILEVADICDQVLEAGLFPEVGAIGLDPHGTAALLDELIDRGYPEPPESLMIYGVEQGFKLNRAIKTLERRTYQKKLLHGNQPLMTWCMGNAKAEARGNNTMITKAKAGTAKIDPLIAMFNCAILMDMNPEAVSRPNLDAFLSSPVMVA